MTLELRVLYVRVRTVGLLVGQTVSLLKTGYLTSLGGMYTLYVNLRNLHCSVCGQPWSSCKVLCGLKNNDGLAFAGCWCSEAGRLRQFVDMTHFTCHNTERHFALNRFWRLWVHFCCGSYVDLLSVCSSLHTAACLCRSLDTVGGV
jgi:hypothetical protein